jgi:predicted DNA-binding transcriptional regulator AlpA
MSQLLKTSDLARVFQVDQKTIHNWVTRELLPTPIQTLGGHLRWTASAIVPVLRAKGYPVPPEWEASHVAGKVAS